MRLALFLGLLAFVNTCHEEKEEPEIVTCWFACIDSYIAKIESEPVRNPAVSITEIHTKSSGVYYFISGYCCDVPSVLLDYNCAVVCHPDGGIAARTGDCPELADETLRQVIWEDKR